MKKLFAFFLAVALLLTLVPFGLFNVTVSAATRNEAVAWLIAQDGAWYDIDGAWGAQCSDFASAYMNWLVSGNPHGGVYGVYMAYYYPTVAGWDTSKWEVISNYYDFVPQPGDIFVTVGADPNCGHVGVVISSNVNTATIIDQNYLNWNLENGSKAVIHEITWTGSYAPTYFIRFKQFSTASLATPTISFDKSSYTLGEAVNISWKASPAGSNLSHYWIAIVDPNGKEVVSKGLGSSVTSYKFTPSSAGTYSVKVYATPVGSQSGEGSLTDTKSIKINPPHTHSYGSWKARKAATCTSNGTDYRTCSCGAEETRTISALGHNYTSVITKPTCTKGGYTTYTCSRCSHSYTGNSTSAKGHTPGAAATCTSAQKCTTCGVTITAAKGHTPGAAATCTSAQKCTTCGVTITAAKGHTPGAAATCTSAQKCTTCGVTITAAKGHTPGSAATCTSAQKCTTCGVTITAAKGHDEGKWEILEDGSEERRCTKCGHLLETVPAPKPKPDPDTDVAFGDVNKDGLIDQYDYILVKRHYFETRYLTDDELLRADINRDEIIDQFDYILIKRIYFGTYTIG